MRHYCNMVDALLEQKEYDEIRNITEHIQYVTDANKVQTYCSNLLVNTMLSKIVKKAHSVSVEMHLDAKVSKEIPVNDYEFTAVIANLLENALFNVQDYEEEKEL